MKWERVYTVNDYYDAPRFGVADYEGEPHIYESKFSDEMDDFEENYSLSRIDEELFALILEDRGIFVEWRQAFDRGEVGTDSHPALEKDQARHNELRDLIGDRFTSDPTTSFLAKATFRNLHKRANGLEVAWERIDG